MRIIKKILFFLIVLAIFTRHDILYSQNLSSTPTYGVKGGILLSTVTGDDAIDQFAKKIGFQIGITGAYYIQPKLSVRGEINYEAKGAKFSNHEMDMNLNYVSVPLYLKFNFTKDPEFYIYGGAYGSYLLSAKTKGTYEKFDVVESINENIIDNITKYDIGIIGGLGVQGRFNRYTDIFLDLRYTQGFINLDNGSSEYRYNFNYTEFWPKQDISKPKNRSIMITVGFVMYVDPR